MRYFLVIVALYFVTHIMEAQADPKARSIDLHKRTTLTAYVVPDMGTRFTFPFILNETDSYIPFTLTSTNSIFENKREDGRNYFVITAPKAGSGTYYGDIFVNVAGFEITIELRTTNDLTKHYSDIVFNLTDDDREDLIQKGVAQRTKALELEYKKKNDDLEFEIDQKAIARIGKLALTSPSHKNIKEEGKLKLPNGDKITLYVDQSVNFDPYSIIVFDLSADTVSKGFAILDVKLFAIDSANKQSRPIQIGKDVPIKIQSEGLTHGAVTLINASVNAKDFLKLQILTDKGTVETQW